MTTEQKLKALQQSDEILKAVRLLIGAFNECELKSHIRFQYVLNGVKYEINFMPIGNEVTYNAGE